MVPPGDDSDHAALYGFDMRITQPSGGPSDSPSFTSRYLLPLGLGPSSWAERTWRRIVNPNVLISTLWAFCF